MLCLTRKLNESIVIMDGLIKVTVLEIEDNKVMLGVEAPKEFPVHREEVQAKVDAEKKP